MKETKFKQTEVGMIPCDWEVKKLGDIAQYRRGSFPQPYGLPKWYDGKGAMPFVQVADVSTDSFCLNSETKQQISTLAQPMSVFVPKNSVLVTLQGSIGKVAITQYDSYVDRTLAIFKAYNLPMSSIYFSYQLSKKFAIEREKAPGGIIKTITKEAFSDFCLPLPPTIKEQQRIANALSDVDTLIANLEKLIAKKKNIKQGAMQQLLTGKKRLPGFGSDERQKECHSERSAKREVEESSGYKKTELGMIPSDWEFEIFGKLVSIYRGGSPRPIEAYITTNPSGINWIKIGDVEGGAKYITSTQERIIPEGKSRSREVHKGDFILSNSMSFGRPYILKVDGCIHDGWLTIQDYQDTFDTDFLYYMLSSEVVFNQYVSMAAGSSVQNLNKEKVATVKLFYPPSKTEQTAIANVLSDMDTEISALETKLAKYRTLKTGMMQQLLTGKIRLV